MQKTGQIERTEDRDFADETAKFKAYVLKTSHPEQQAIVLALNVNIRSYEKETLALQKDSKAFLDGMRGV